MIKKILHRLAFCVAITVCAVSCGSSPTVGESFTAAEHAAETRHYQAAREIADELFEKAEANRLSASELGRLSLLFMRLSENGGEQENIGQATQCYLKAFAANADSARAYYASLPLDESSYVEMMASLSRAITSPAAVTGHDEWCDTQDSIEINDIAHEE